MTDCGTKAWIRCGGYDHKLTADYAVPDNDRRVRRTKIKDEITAVLPAGPANDAIYRGPFGFRHAKWRR